jgi:hypothetical protein
MGTTSSKVSAKSITNQLMSVVSSAVATAGNSNVGGNVLILDGACNLENTTITQKNTVKVTADIIQSVVNSVTTKNNLEQKVKQISAAEAPNLNLAGSTKSSTFTELITNISTAISSSSTASCSQNNFYSNVIRCTGNAKERDGQILQENVGDYMFACSQKIDQVTNAQQELQTFIDQQSTSKVKDVITGILIVVAVIIVLCIVGYLVVKMGGGKPRIPRSAPATSYPRPAYPELQPVYAQQQAYAQQPQQVYAPPPQLVYAQPPQQVYSQHPVYSQQAYAQPQQVYLQTTQSRPPPPPLANLATGRNFDIDSTPIITNQISTNLIPTTPTKLLPTTNLLPNNPLSTTPTTPTAD